MSEKTSLLTAGGFADRVLRMAWEFERMTNRRPTLYLGYGTERQVKAAFDFFRAGGEVGTEPKNASHIKEIFGLPVLIVNVEEHLNVG